MNPYLRIAMLQFQQSVAYRFDMLFSLVSIPLTIVIQWFIWTTLLHSSDIYTLTEILTYYIAVNLLFVWTYNAAHEKVSRRVEQGQFHTVLLRPISQIKEQFSIILGDRFMAFFLEIMPIILIITIFFSPSFLIPVFPFFFIISLFTALILNFFFKYTIGLLAFYMKSNHGLRMITWGVSFLLAGSGLPLDLYPQSIQKILVLLPFQHMLYAPAAYFSGIFSLGNVSILNNTLLALTWVMLGFIGVYFLEKSAIKRYSGVGQ